VGDHLGNPDEIAGFPIFPPGTKSLLAKYLTREMWDKYKDSSDNLNYSFKTAIFSGCKNTNSGIGVYAGSPSSYDCFNDLFDKII